MLKKLEELLAKEVRNDDLCQRQKRPVSQKSLLQCPRCGCWMTEQKLLQHLTPESYYGCKHLPPGERGLQEFSQRTGATVTVVERGGRKETTLTGFRSKEDHDECLRAARNVAKKLGREKDVASGAPPAVQAFPRHGDRGHEA